MKKLKKLSTALLASMLVLPMLAGCSLLGNITDTINDIFNKDNKEDEKPDPTPELHPAVNSVSFSTQSVEISAGEQSTATVTVNVTDGASQEVTYSVINSSVVEILTSTNSSVTFVGLTEGTAYIKATSTFDSSKVASLSVTVIQPEITTFSVDKNNLELCKDSTATVTASLTKIGVISDEVRWESLDSTIANVVSVSGYTATIKAIKAGTTTIKAYAVGDNTKFQEIAVTVYNPSIELIALDKNSFDLGLGLEETFTVTLTTKGTAEHLNEVEWSVENSTIASIISSDNTSATLKGLIAGQSTTLTVKSKYDTTKSASAVINVVDKGFAPEIYDQNYQFITTGYPTALLKNFIGEGTYDIFMPSADAYADGCYFKVNEETDDNYAYAEVIMCSIMDEDEYNARMEEFEQGGSGFYSYLDSAVYTQVVINEDLNYAVMFNYVATSEDEETADYLLDYVYYRLSDLNSGSSTITTDEDWDQQIKDVLPTIFGENVDIPFVKIGKDYTVAYAIDDEYYGTYFDVYDYSPNYKISEQVKQDLVSSGFVYDESSMAYAKNIDGMTSLFISVDFSVMYGNYLSFTLGPTVLDAFPTSLVNDYTENTIGTQWRVIPFEATSRTLGDTNRPAEYRASIEEDSQGEYFRVSGLYMNEQEFASYAQSYKNAGFVTLMEPTGNEVDCYGYVFSVGKLVVSINLYAESEIDWDNFEMIYNFDNSTVELIVYTIEGLSDDFWLDQMEVTLGVGETVTVNASFGSTVEVHTLVWTTSDSSVATVNNGVITAVGIGDAEITATISGTNISSTVYVTVSNGILDVLDDLNAWVESVGGTEVFDLPDVDGATYYEGEYDEEYECYSIYIGTTNYYADEDYVTVLIEAGYDAYYDEEYGYMVDTEEFTISIWCTGEYLELDFYFVGSGGGSEEGEGMSFDFSSYTETSGSGNGIEFVTDTAGNTSGTAPAYNTSKGELRLYIGNTITISSDSTITSVFFEANNCGEEKANGTLSADSGTITVVDDGFYWEGSANEVTFTVDSGKQVHITYLEINGGGSGSGTGGGTTGGDDIEENELSLGAKAIAVDFACSYFELSESELTYASYTDEEAEADIFTYSSDDLFFYCVYSMMEGNYDEVADDAVTYLPSGATFESSLSESDSDVGYCDYYYSYGNYYIAVYTQDYNEYAEYFEVETLCSLEVDIFPKTMLSAYQQLMY